MRKLMLILFGALSLSAPAALVVVDNCCGDPTCWPPTCPPAVMSSIYRK